MRTRSTEHSTYRGRTDNLKKPLSSDLHSQSPNTPTRTSRHRNPVGAAPAHGGVIDFREAQRQREAQRRLDAERQRDARRQEEQQQASEAARAYAEPARQLPVSHGDAGEASGEQRFSSDTQKRDARRAQRVARYEERQKRDEKRQSRLESRRAQCPACHWGLLVLTTLLALLSIPIVYSASIPQALAMKKSADYFFIRQVIFVIVGYGAFVVLSRMNQRQRRMVVWGMYAVAILGMLAIDFTPLGVMKEGVRRWIRLPGLPDQQVSELAKLALIGIMADFWSRAAVTSRNARWPWLVSAALTLPMIGLVFIQPHLSAALVLFCLPLFIAFYAGVPFRHFSVIMVPLVIGGIVVIGLCKYHAMPLLKTYQQDRIAAHLGSKGHDAQGSNYQKLQSMLTLQSGSLLGRGPGQSLAKQGHLPEAHTDFIFSVIGEEWGLVGTLGLLLAYGTMIFFCFHIGHCAETTFDSLLCAGVGTLLAIQVTCNVGVATGVLPVTGMPLPFMSYGGSSLLCVLMGVGMVLSVSRQTSRSAQAAQAALAAQDNAEVMEYAPVRQPEVELHPMPRKPLRSTTGHSGAVA